MLLHFFRISLLLALQMGFYYHANYRALSISNHTTVFDNSKADKETNPVISPQDIIFEVKHSKSPNVVVYQANKTLSKILNPQKPIDVYWLMNTKGKTTETLTTIEWKLAFGYKLIPVVAGKKYKISLNAIKNREITISLSEEGKAEAYMNINGVYSKLIGVFIDFEYSFYLPKVKYVEFTGYGVNSAKRCVERITSES